MVNSSSSENVDSSSGEDDGDDDESSSSSGDEECGTGTGHCPVSSSSFNGGPYGYVEDLEPCDEINEYMILAGFDYTWKMAEHTYVAINPRKFKIPRFTKKPGFYGELYSGFLYLPRLQSRIHG